MKTNKLEENGTRAEILLSVPGELLEDLKKIARFNNSRIEDLAYCYIVDGISSDSRIVKRMEFSDNANENLGDKTFHKKTAKEIINDFNLVY